MALCSVVMILQHTKNLDQIKKLNFLSMANYAYNTQLCGIIVYIKHILNRKIGDDMYEKGDLVIYGNQSVCRIENIGAINIGQHPNERVYYTLNPIYIDGRTYIPVDTQVYMRHLITSKEAMNLITTIPEIPLDIIIDQNAKQLMDYYKETISEYTCEGLLQLICNINAKQELLLSQKKRLGQTDERYKKEAEALLCQEFAIVLNISRETVSKYIEGQIKLA